MQNENVFKLSIKASSKQRRLRGAQSLYAPKMNHRCFRWEHLTLSLPSSAHDGVMVWGWQCGVHQEKVEIGDCKQSTPDLTQNENCQRGNLTKVPMRSPRWNK